MKRIISFMLAFAILLSLSLTVNALNYNDFLNIDDKSQYDMDAYYQELWINYETNTSSLWNYICGNQCNTYVQIANHFEGNGWYEFVTKWTKQELTKERYVEILVNLMTLMDYTTHDMIEKQVDADTLKTFGDYAIDVSEILVGTVTLHSTFSSRITEPMKKIATAMGLTSGAVNLTVETIEAYKYLDWTLQTYEHHDQFLTAIIQNTDDELLRDAANELSDIVNKAFYCKINAVSDISENTAEYIGKDVFFDTIVLDKMLKDASILDLSESDLAILDLLKNTYSVFTTSLSYIQDWSVFISDMLGGSSDVMNRYNEMRALTTIREALIKQVELYRSNIEDGSDYVEIGKLCTLMKDLVCVNYRGEYCMHEMLVHDGQAFSLVVQWNGEAMTYDEIFEQTKIYTVAYIDAIDSIFPDPELYRLPDVTEVPDDNERTDVLTYPISEELCYVIFERRFGHPMEDGAERVEVSHFGSGDDECFYFNIYSEMDTLPGLPELYFVVYVNTGKCEEGVPTGHNFTFNAEDYFSIGTANDEPPTEGFAGNQTVDQLRKSIVGSWGREGAIVSDYDFISDGTCYWSFEKQIGGTYKIRDDKMLLITFPWMDDRYFWTEETYEEWRSHSSDDCWYMTDSGVLVLNGVSYYRDGKVIKDYNTEGGLLATIAGSWVLDDFTEYRFFMDGTYEENMVSVSYGILFSRVDIDAGPIEIVDDTHAKLWHEADSFGEIPYYTELVYDPETDTLRIGGSNNVYHRAEYSD